jgi:hypothetical protein
VFSRWSRAFVFIAVAALIANAHCFGDCASDAYPSTKTPPNSCHHQKSSHEDTVRCSHQQSEFTGPDIGIAKVNVGGAVAILPALVLDAVAISSQSRFLSQLDTGSPPGNGCCSTISVLRI